MKLPKKFQTFFYKSHFTSLVEVILGEPTRPVLEVESALGLWISGGMTGRERKGSFGETALLRSRNAVSRYMRKSLSVPMI